MTMLLQIAAAPASADVLEIGADGAVRVRGGAADVTWIDATGVDATGVDATGEEAGTGAKVALAVPAGALTPIAAPVMPDSWRAPLETAAARYRVSPTLLAALVWQESRWHPAAVSAKGAVGLTQLMPSTARALTVDARDPAANLDGGAHYLRQMLDLFDGDVERALAAYNAGPGRVLRAGGLPAIAETRAYVSTIIDRLTPDLATGRP